MSKSKSNRNNLTPARAGMSAARPQPAGRLVVEIHGRAAEEICRVLASPDPRSTRGWVDRCCTAAAAAHREIMHAPPPRTDLGSASRLLLKLSPDQEEPRDSRLGGPELEQAAHQAASIAFRAALPLLTGRKNAAAYLACLAVGTQRCYLAPAEARNLLYTAQLALAAYKRPGGGS